MTSARIINHHGNVEEVSAPLPIIERLTRTPANSNRVMPVNPDGPKAARIIAELYALLVILEWGDDERPGCPFCGMGKETGHLERCQMNDALNSVRGEQ